MREKHSLTTYSRSTDDSTVDYLSMLGREDRKRRFSERLEDRGLKETVDLQKLFRQIQIQVFIRTTGCFRFIVQMFEFITKGRKHPSS